jgi:steroid delta-isomerase-like uncharacterized protein
MSDEIKAAVRRAYDAMNTGDLAFLAEAMADDFVEHEQFPGMPPTKEGTLQIFKALRESFPDLRMTLHDMIAEGDKVFIRATMSGTHRGMFMGMPATAKHFSVPIADFLRFRNGKVVEHWGVTDSGTMMQQLGVVELPALG